MDDFEDLAGRYAAQIRAGRSYLGWSQRRLAEASCLPVRTIVRLECADGRFRRRTFAAVRVALGMAGVVVRGAGSGGRVVEGWGTSGRGVVGVGDFAEGD